MPGSKLQKHQKLFRCSRNFCPWRTASRSVDALLSCAKSHLKTTDSCLQSLILTPKDDHIILQDIHSIFQKPQSKQRRGRLIGHIGEASLERRDHAK